MVLDRYPSFEEIDVPHDIGECRWEFLWLVIRNEVGVLFLNIIFSILDFEYIRVVFLH